MVVAMDQRANELVVKVEREPGVVDESTVEIAARSGTSIPV